MPLTLRLWLIFSKVFAFALRRGTARMHRKQGLSAARFTERLGRACVPRPQGRLVWIHAASLGEVAQTAQLVKTLREAQNCEVIITTMTGSGAGWVAKSLPDVIHQFVPIDTPAAVRGFLDHWAPDMALFIEADLWPRLVLETAARDIPLALLNARPSKSRQRAPQFYGHLLSHFEVITCKSQDVLDGLRDLGLPAQRLHFFGDLRACVPPLPVDQSGLNTLRAAIGTRPVWIAASSHAQDEGAIVIACKAVLDRHPDALLIWAPRHPDRAKDIIAISKGLVLHQRSISEPIKGETQIYLADTFNEFGLLFSLGDVVFLGGSFGTQGGHNPYEPAGFGCFILTGPNIRNHQEAFAEFIDAGAAQCVVDGTELGASVGSLLASQSTAALGAAGRKLVRAANTSAARTAAVLGDVLRPAATAEVHIPQSGMIRYDADVLPQMDAGFFDFETHRAQGQITGTATGRGAAYFLRIGDLDLVLRPYLRGGMIGRFNRDRFLRKAPRTSRAFREYALLEWMRGQGLPVPQPVAALYAPDGLFYRAALVTRMIPDTKTLAELLQGGTLHSDTWRRIGVVIREMHDLGVHHSDLNCRNILLDGQMQPWLIDFDKCERRTTGPWQDESLERLHRSLQKEHGKHPALAWAPEDWAALRAGYERGSA